MDLNPLRIMPGVSPAARRTSIAMMAGGGVVWLRSTAHAYRVGWGGMDWVWGPWLLGLTVLIAGVTLLAAANARELRARRLGRWVVGSGALLGLSLYLPALGILLAGDTVKAVAWLAALALGVASAISWVVADSLIRRRVKSARRGLTPGAPR